MIMFIGSSVSQKAWYKVFLICHAVNCNIHFLSSLTMDGARDRESLLRRH